MTKEIENQVLRELSVLSVDDEFEFTLTAKRLKELIRLTEKIVDEKWHTRNRKMGEAYDEIIANKLGLDASQVKQAIDEEKQKLLAEIRKLIKNDCKTNLEKPCTHNSILEILEDLKE